MDTQDDTQDETDEGNAEQGSGERPESPEKGTFPPGNPDPDPERVEQASEEAEQTKPY